MTALWIAIGFVGLGAIVLIFVKCRDAAYRRSGLLPAVGHATMPDVERLVRSGQRILAIRCYREVHHVSLVEAKKAVDNLRIAS